MSNSNNEQFNQCQDKYYMVVNPRDNIETLTEEIEMRVAGAV